LSAGGWARVARGIGLGEAGDEAQAASMHTAIPAAMTKSQYLDKVFPPVHDFTPTCQDGAYF